MRYEIFLLAGESKFLSSSSNLLASNFSRVYVFTLLRGNAGISYVSKQSLKSNLPILAEILASKLVGSTWGSFLYLLRARGGEEPAQSLVLRVRAEARPEEDDPEVGRCAAPAAPNDRE